MHTARALRVGPGWWQISACAVPVCQAEANKPYYGGDGGGAGASTQTPLLKSMVLHARLLVHAGHATQDVAATVAAMTTEAQARHPLSRG